MSQARPDFADSPYFVTEPGNWHLKPGAPKEVKKEFQEYMLHGICEKVIDFAKQQGYDSAEYIGKWRGYDVYEPLFAGDEVSVVGPPLIILVKGAKIRMSTEDEAYEQLSESIG